MSEETLIAIYVPARASIFNVRASELQDKLDNLRQHKDVLFRFFFVLSSTQERDVRAALQK